MRGYRRQAGQSNVQNNGPGRATIPSSLAARRARHATRGVAPSAGAGRVRQYSAHGMPPPRAAAPRGFTLIEMMIVVVIVSILLLVGLPAYRKQVIQGNRAEGTAALLRIMDRQERYYANNFPPTYASSMTGLGFSSVNLETENGHYSIAVGNCTGSTDLKSCVKLTATAQGGQTDDGDLTLNSRGEKTRDGNPGWD